jgi:ankyrin repeat protein
MEDIFDIIRADNNARLTEWLNIYPQDWETTRFGVSTLVIAVKFASWKCLAILASVFPNLDDGDDLNPSALEIAIEFGDAESTDILLNHGASLNIRYNQAITKLFATDNADCLKILISHGAHPVLTNGGTPLLEMAVVKKARKCLKCFMDIINPTDLLDISNRASLWRLVLGSAYLEIVETLQHLPLFRSTINNRTIEGKNCLHLAMKKHSPREEQFKKLKIIKILLENGVDVNQQDREGNTPLHLANDIRSAKLLMSWGAKTSIKNNQGHRPTEENMDWLWSNDTHNWCLWKEEETNSTRQERIEEDDLFR